MCNKSNEKHEHDLRQKHQQIEPCHVQLLNTMCTNKKKRMDCFDDTMKTRRKPGKIIGVLDNDVGSEGFREFDDEL